MASMSLSSAGGAGGGQGPGQSPGGDDHNGGNDDGGGGGGRKPPLRVMCLSCGRQAFAFSGRPHACKLFHRRFLVAFMNTATRSVSNPNPNIGIDSNRNGHAAQASSSSSSSSSVGISLALPGGEPTGVAAGGAGGGGGSVGAITTQQASVAVTSSFYNLAPVNQLNVPGVGHAEAVQERRRHRLSEHHPYGSRSPSSASSTKEQQSQAQLAHAEQRQVGQVFVGQGPGTPVPTQGRLGLLQQQQQQHQQQASGSQSMSLVQEGQQQSARQSHSGLTQSTRAHLSLGSSLVPGRQQQQQQQQAAVPVSPYVVGSPRHMSAELPAQQQQGPEGGNRNVSLPPPPPPSQAVVQENQPQPNPPPQPYRSYMITEYRRRRQLRQELSDSDDDSDDSEDSEEDEQQQQRQQAVVAPGIAEMLIRALMPSPSPPSGQQVVRGNEGQGPRQQQPTGVYGVQQQQQQQQGVHPNVVPGPSQQIGAMPEGNAYQHYGTSQALAYPQPCHCPGTFQATFASNYYNLAGPALDRQQQQQQQQQQQHLLVSDPQGSNAVQQRPSVIQYASSDARLAAAAVAAAEFNENVRPQNLFQQVARPQAHFENQQQPLLVFNPSGQLSPEFFPEMDRAGPFGRQPVQHAAAGAGAQAAPSVQLVYGHEGGGRFRLSHLVVGVPHLGRFVYPWPMDQILVALAQPPPPNWNVAHAVLNVGGEALVPSARQNVPNFERAEASLSPPPVPLHQRPVQFSMRRATLAALAAGLNVERPHFDDAGERALLELANQRRHRQHQLPGANDFGAAGPSGGNAGAAGALANAGGEFIERANAGAEIMVPANAGAGPILEPELMAPANARPASILEAAAMGPPQRPPPAAAAARNAQRFAQNANVSSNSNVFPGHVRHFRAPLAVDCVGEEEEEWRSNAPTETPAPAPRRVVQRVWPMGTGRFLDTGRGTAPPSASSRAAIAARVAAIRQRHAELVQSQSTADEYVDVVGGNYGVSDLLRENRGVLDTSASSLEMFIGQEARRGHSSLGSMQDNVDYHPFALSYSERTGHRQSGSSSGRNAGQPSSSLSSSGSFGKRPYSVQDLLPVLAFNENARRGVPTADDMPEENVAIEVANGSDQENALQEAPVPLQSNQPESKENEKADK